MRTTIAIAWLLASPAVLAQGNSQSPMANAHPSISVAITGLSCSTGAGSGTFAAQAWSWGATIPPGGQFGGGGGTGAAVVSPLTIQKQFDGCSPALLDATLTGRHFKTLTLSQQNANGDATATILVEDVVLSGWQASSSAAQNSPGETLPIRPARLCITDVPSGSKFCYDFTANKPF